jgi:hypothetical protein
MLVMVGELVEEMFCVVSLALIENLVAVVIALALLLFDICMLNEDCSYHIFVLVLNTKLH